MISKTLKLWLPVIAWVTLIFLFSANPNPYKLLPDAIEGTWDTFIGITMHFIEYTILAFLLSRALYHHQTTTRKNLLIIILLTMLYALTDEIHQLFVPGRTFQIFDLLIDLLGSITGILIYKKLLKARSAKSKSSKLKSQF